MYLTNNAYVFLGIDGTVCYAALFHNVSHSVLFQPQFQPKCVDAVQIVSKQTFVSHEAEFLIQMKRCTVGNFRLQYNLKTQIHINIKFNTQRDTRYATSQRLSLFSHYTLLLVM